ncbi:RYamide receptor-like [Diadema antillarum]|uniref:RYamide receptor-like n=1 Tax=Diadema antillarum TaxID=105358 RepID=UPI003A8C77DF
MAYFAQNETTDITVTLTPLSQMEQADGYFKEPPWLQVFIIIIYAAVSILGVGGNVVVCYIVLGHARMRTVTNYFIVNLAVGDILMAVVCVNLTLYSTLYITWPFGSAMCKITSFIQSLSVSVSIFTLIAISLDRFVAIMYPLRPRMTAGQTIIIALSIWIFAGAFAMPMLIYASVAFDASASYCTDSSWSFTRHYSWMGLVIQYLLPLGILAVVYICLGLKIWGRRTPGEVQATRDKKLSESKTKLVKMFATVVLIFALCYLPLHTFNLIQDMHSSILYFRYIKLIFLSCHLLSMSNCFVNPFIYCWMNTKFRNGFKAVFRCLPGVEYDPDWAGTKTHERRGTSHTQLESMSMSSRSDRSKWGSEKFQRNGSTTNHRRLSDLIAATEKSHHSVL